ncbi:MAG: hypothetical protein ACLRWP_10185 [Bilophila wadsworthia]
MVPAQEAVFAVLHGNAAGDHVEQPLEVVLPAAHFFEVVLIADAEFNDGPRELANSSSRRASSRVTACPSRMACILAIMRPMGRRTSYQ